LRFFLGIDGGGSKCDAVVIDEAGSVRGWGKAGATGYTSEQQAEQACHQALAEALGELSVREVEMATLWIRNCATAWLEARGIVVHRHLVSEWDCSFAAADRSWGVAVHAGTGSWVNGRTEDGRQVHMGGMGPFVGDDGGGWDIGLRGIKAALRSRWSQRIHTSLAEAVPQALGVADLGKAVIGLPITSGQITRGQVASVAPAVIQEAAAGDRIARDILEAAAAELAELCGLVLDELDIVGQGYPLIGIAGVIQGSPLYWEILLGKILEYDATLVPEVPAVRMVVAAAMLAMQSAGLRVTEQIRERILATQTAFPAARVVTQS